MRYWEGEERISKIKNRNAGFSKQRKFSVLQKTDPYNTVTNNTKTLAHKNEKCRL